MDYSVISIRGGPFLYTIRLKCYQKKKVAHFCFRFVLPAFNFNNGLLGDPGAIRTRGVPLRRRKQGFPPIPLECPQTLAITAFLTNSIVPVSSKKHLFYPSAIRQRLDKLIGGGRTFSDNVRQN